MFDKILERVSKVRLSGGLVGRVCTVLLVACAALGAIGVMSRNEWVMGGAIISILILAFPLLWRIIGFAEQHPHVAILDGAQFLKHEQLVLAAKDIPEITVSPESQMPAHTALLPSGTSTESDMPDNAVVLPGATDERSES